jgi:hypothetical protein
MSGAAVADTPPAVVDTQAAAVAAILAVEVAGMPAAVIAKWRRKNFV